MENKTQKRTKTLTYWSQQKAEMYVTKILTDKKKLMVVEAALHISGKEAVIEKIGAEGLETMREAIEDFNNSEGDPVETEIRYYRLATICEQVRPMALMCDDKHYLKQFQQITNELIPD